MEVTLTEGLQTGRCWLQVYRGRLCVNSKTEPKLEADVVVKLFHECLFPDPVTWDTFDPNKATYHEWVSASEIFQAEAWAYDRPEDIQGTITPHHHGSYLVCANRSRRALFIHFVLIQSAQWRRSRRCCPGVYPRVGLTSVC